VGYDKKQQNLFFVIAPLEDLTQLVSHLCISIVDNEIIGVAKSVGNTYI
jgi:hypothetical protein